MPDKGKIAVLLSGRGSNFRAIYRASLETDANFRVAAVISDKPEAPGLALARELGIPAFYISPENRKKSAYETEILNVLRPFNPQLLCLAGYMRVLGKTLLEAFPGAALNIHPSLLPAFPGLNAQEQALNYGAKVTGCTAHFVDPGVDTGPIILQHPVDILPSDTPDSLSERILAFEHQIFPQAIRLFFNNQLKISGRKVIISS